MRPQPWSQAAALIAEHAVCLVLSSAVARGSKSCSELDSAELWAGLVGGHHKLCACPWGSEPDGDPRGPYAGPAMLPLCLQSSGNVWVTHEEMETLATSAETVSVALCLGEGW